MKFAIENSTWNNIGDAFYQQSIVEVFRRTFPNDQVVTFDGPADRAFHHGNWMRNTLDARTWVEADHFVFSGPIMSNTFLARHEPLIRKIREQGKSYSLISVHGGAVGSTLDAIRKFLTEHPPAAIHTRDTDTFEKLKDLVPHQLSGICFAFFVKLMENIPDLQPDAPYICCSFYSKPEPGFEITRDKHGAIAELSFTKRPTTTLPWRLARHLQSRRPYPKSENGFEIVRPVHDAHKFPHITFAKPGTYITYNPKAFLSIYKHTSATISDRVHAGVVTLSFGKPALIDKIDGRAKLFDNSAVSERNGVLRADQFEIDRHYKNHVEWLKNIPF